MAARRPHRTTQLSRSAPVSSGTLHYFFGESSTPRQTGAIQSLLTIPNHVQLQWNARDNGVTVFHDPSGYGNPLIGKVADYRVRLAGDGWLATRSIGRSR